jgi:hypothetical protein
MFFRPLFGRVRRDHPKRAVTTPWPFFAALSLLGCDEAPVRYVRAELDGAPVKWMTGKLTLASTVTSRSRPQRAHELAP